MRAVIEMEQALREHQEAPASLGSQRSPGTWSDTGKQNLSFEGQAVS